MDDIAVVLNAGSSSLKFCVYQGPDPRAWRLDARGQVEGIGVSPRFSVKDGTGHTTAQHRVDSDVHDARSALGFVATWLRTHYSGARVAGVGHRVVHGGARYTHPTMVTPEIL